MVEPLAGQAQLDPLAGAAAVRDPGAVRVAVQGLGARAPTSSKKREEELATTAPEAPANRSTTGRAGPARPRPAGDTELARRRQPQLAVEVRSSSWKRSPASPAARVRTTSIGAASSGPGRRGRGRRRAGAGSGRRDLADLDPGHADLPEAHRVEPDPRTWVISTVTLAVVASGTSTDLGLGRTGTSTVPASTRTDPGDLDSRLGQHRAQDDRPHLGRLVQGHGDRLADRAAEVARRPGGPPVAVEGELRLAERGGGEQRARPGGGHPGRPSRRVTVWVSGSPNRVRVEEGGGWSARSVGEWFWPVRKLPQARRRLLSVTTTWPRRPPRRPGSAGVTEPSSRNAGSPGAAQPDQGRDGEAVPVDQHRPWSARSARSAGPGPRHSAAAAARPRPPGPGRAGRSRRPGPRCARRGGRRRRPGRATGRRPAARPPPRAAAAEGLPALVVADHHLGHAQVPGRARPPPGRGRHRRPEVEGGQEVGLLERAVGHGGPDHRGPRQQRQVDVVGPLHPPPVGGVAGPGASRTRVSSPALTSAASSRQ